ncbi:protein IQ-DOMAIN 31-like [Punica granatum]|uniref:Protein IQ-DOMAIN 31-like n=1 Tax=Punica granatum TaxID=22663 RepID=A0A218WT52_PUNGR|nr:protein IQ-DOMAIN 31-like [Punica granatum]OWM75965.1 hypothetical protein CDL15_Pgr009610 [Punica granatum]
MGRTPGKWFKTLLGKRSSKSNVLKEKDVLNSANRGEDLTPSKGLLTEIANPPLSSLPVPGTNATNEINLENAVAGKVPDNADTLSSRNGSDEQTVVCLSSLDDSEKVRLQEAATKAQAAFRGYLARRAFRTLKGIVRLQAVIRGHLVRRQAIATLFCLRGIVRLQMLARSRRGYKPSNPVGKHGEKLWKNAFIQKLLAPSPSAMPLHYQYSPGDPNCEWEWLERWTRSRFWETISQPKKNSHSKSQAKHHNAEIDQGRPKRSVRKLPSLNPDIGSSRSSSQSDKIKRNTGKISHNAGDSVKENSQTETQKSKLVARKTHALAKGVADQGEADSKKSRQSLGKVAGATASDAVEQVISDLAEAVNETGMDGATPKRTLRPADMVDAVDELHEKSLPQLNISESNGNAEKELNSNDGSVSNENKKSSQRRASLPAKIEQQENGTPSATKVPSYMAPTHSAKARLRAQGSPRFIQDNAGTNDGATRRHSLPSSTNGKVTSFSPRVHRLVEASGKGAMKNDKSLTSSRDGGEKVIKAEWKR